MSGPAELTSEQIRYRETRKVTLVGAIIDLLLGVAKIIVGIIGQSQALIADGIHSLSDLFTDGLVLYAAKHASRGADEDHPYGHGRIETVMTVGLGMALIGVAGGIGWDSIMRMTDPEKLLEPNWLTLVVAGLSILSKEWIYHYTLRVANRIRSNLLRANAWHSRTDAISSIIVFIGIVGTMLGIEYLDAVAALGVAILIGKIGWELAWHSLKELVDTSLEQERVAEIRETIESIPGITGLHMLRTRRMGADALVDVHIQVENPRMSVSEGHQLSDIVRYRIIKDFEEVTDVLVHIDPEDDDEAPDNSKLPARNVLVPQLRAALQSLESASRIESFNLHYLSGEIQVEILLPLDLIHDIKDAAKIRKAYRDKLESVECLGEIDVHFH